jgi:hypothetical protein
MRMYSAFSAETTDWREGFDWAQRAFLRVPSVISVITQWPIVLLPWGRDRHSLSIQHHEMLRILKNIYSRGLTWTNQVLARVQSGKCKPECSGSYHCKCYTRCVTSAEKQLVTLDVARLSHDSLA